MTKENVLALAVALIVLIGLYFGSVYLRDNTTVQTPNPPLQSQVDSSNNDIGPEEVGNYKYVYQSNYDMEERNDWSENTFDGKIFKVDLKTGEMTMIVPSVKAIYAPIKQSINYGLQVLYNPVDSPYIYFNMIAYETDGPAADVIKFDANSKSMSKLKISNYYESFGSVPSKTSAYAVSIVDPNAKQGINSTTKKLYLLDYEKDSVRLLTELPEGQTFNSCEIEGCLGSYGLGATWLNDRELNVEIYNANPTRDQYGNGKLEVLETKKFKI